MKKILIIEDDDTSRNTIVDALELEGYIVHAAINGEEGIKMAQEFLPNLIICDIRMPGKNGLEVCQILQKEDNTATIPFIFLTANAELSDIRLGLQLGADDYITKPFDYDELISSISRRLEKHQRIIETTESKFKILLENSLYGTFIMQENKIIFANNKFHKTLLYSKEEIIRINFYDIIHKGSLDFFRNKVFRCLSGIDRKAQFETVFLNKNKKEINVELFFGLTNINGKATIIGSFNEIDSNKINNIEDLDNAIKRIID
ncbi:MAG: hypothetical protein A2X12_07575 [Bacteroidetes bacterium GWE2_29_8]|nr:MAG: hypothetical protein A2X12_07575 [Bacteroidetes bacterium GWE2_29_8]